MNDVQNKPETRAKYPIKKARVLVVGSGIAGTCAAVRAAEVLREKQENSTVRSEAYSETCSGISSERSYAEAHHKNPSVMLACQGSLFSGSSFFEGTWGLGLIAPSDTKDEDDLAQTILQVGCGVANEQLVKSFVAGIVPAIARLEQWGVALKHATENASQQQEYIPCFDHKHRAWHGIERAPYVAAMSKQLHQTGVCVQQGCQLLDIDATTRIATFFDTEHTNTNPSFVQVHYDALVLCTGGTSSLYTRHLTQHDCCATTQGLAAQLGCRLVNMAFLQFMPGIISPVQGVVFNEKTFRYMQLDAATVQQLGGAQRTQQLLDMRSAYGPFTCRLESCAIDFAIHNAGGNGLALVPHFNDAQKLPEFVQTYQTWLKNSAGVSAETPLRIAMYAHASNGGIVIDARAATTMPGIFAAGECTGGMHGADRLGGLSSANGLVFGMRAGESAATWALNASHEGEQTNYAELPVWTLVSSAQTQRIEQELAHIMDTACMIVRKRTQLEAAQQRLSELIDQLSASSAETNSAACAAQTRTTCLRLLTAQEMVADMLRQPTSCGSHYLEDAPPC